MNFKTLFSALFLATAMNASAQLKIDINNSGRAVSEGLASGYTAWTFGRVTSAQETFKHSDGSDVTIKILPVEGLGGNAVRTNYWKQGVVNYGYKLLADGCYVIELEDPTGTSNDYVDVKEGSSGIRLEITGLAAGNHSILAYHNAVDGWSSVPPLMVRVNGTVVARDVQQTIRATKEIESGQSYITFTSGEGETVVVEYITVPASGQTYSVTVPTINGIVFDEANTTLQAMDPTPANNDWHVDADNGSCTLKWKPAANAVKHHVMLGTEKGNLKEIAVVSDTTYIITDLNTVDTYYWRIDEEDAAGVVTKSEEWSFRKRQLAFPGAEGYGRYATGGRGGYVYHVTSLADTNEPGTLRYGIENLDGARTIVFDVGGVIELKSRLVSSDSCVTIAGQTAPGVGIMMRNKPFGMGNEGVTRFLRLRLGGGDSWDGVSPNDNTADGMGMTGNDFSIMDHCSIGWSIDEAFSSRNAKNMTLQRTLISEALNYAGHATQYDRHGYHVAHGYAATIGGQAGSYHHNLLAHCAGRNWSMGGGLDGGGYLAGQLDMFNNVCYNWHTRTTDGGTHESQFVNNYYKMGPDTELKNLFSQDHEGVGIGTQRAYVSGNIRENKDGTLSTDKYGDTYCYTGSVDYETFVDQPFFPSYATIETAQEAFKSVLTDVGCNQPMLDNHDIRIINETLNGKVSTVGTYTGLRGIIDKESDAEGFDGLNIIEVSRDSSFDTDQDGMPDWWEKLNWLNPSNADNNGDPDGNGYTNLEEYLNWMAESHIIISPAASETIDLSTLFMGFNKSPLYSLNTTGDGIEASVSSNILTLKANDGFVGMSDVAVTVTDSDGSVRTRNIGVAVTYGTSSDIVSVKTDSLVPVSYELFTSDGKLVKTGKYNDTEIMKGVNRGIYILKIIDKTGKAVALKINKD